MSKSLLVTRPNHDEPTNYLYHWSQSVIDETKRKQIPVYDLFGKKAIRTTFISYMQSRHPRLLFFNGHGDAEHILGWDNDILLKATDSNLISQAIVFARNCDSARTLGPTLVRKGIAAFIGYTRKFVFFTIKAKVSKPLEDKLARLFLGPSNLIPTTIIKGHSARVAYDRSRQEMIKNFRKMIKSTASFEERYASRWLWSDIRSQVLLGDKNARF